MLESSSLVPAADGKVAPAAAHHGVHGGHGGFVVVLLLLLLAPEVLLRQELVRLVHLEMEVAPRSQKRVAKVKTKELNN